MKVYAGRQFDDSLKLTIKLQLERLQQKINLSFFVVSRFISEILGSGRNVTFDNWYAIYFFITSLVYDHKLSKIEKDFKKKNRELRRNFHQSKAGCLKIVFLELV